MLKLQKLLGETYKFFYKQVNQKELSPKEISYIQSCYEQMDEEIKKLKKDEKVISSKKK